MLLVGGFDELVHEPGGEGVSDAVALLGGGGAERDEQVGLAGAGVPDQAQRVAAADPVAGGELVDGGGVDVGVRGEVEVGEPFLAGEAGALDATQGGAAVAAVTASSTTARIVGSRSRWQAWSIAACAACSVRPC